MTCWDVPCAHQPNRCFRCHCNAARSKKVWTVSKILQDCCQLHGDDFCLHFLATTSGCCYCCCWIVVFCVRLVVSLTLPLQQSATPTLCVHLRCLVGPLGNAPVSRVRQVSRQARQDLTCVCACVLICFWNSKDKTKL